MYWLSAHVKSKSEPALKPLILMALPAACPAKVLQAFGYYRGGGTKSVYVSHAIRTAKTCHVLCRPDERGKIAIGASVQLDADADRDGWLYGHGEADEYLVVDQWIEKLNFALRIPLRGAC
jgi:hypothetical protein